MAYLTRSEILRSRGQIATVPDGAAFDVIGVQPDAFARVATFRSDFLNLSLSELMDSIKVSGNVEPILLPSDADEIGVWLHTDDNVPNLFAWVRIRTGGGIETVVTLGGIEPGPWRFQSASVDGFVPPLELLGFQVFEGASSSTGSETIVMVDDVTAVSISDDGTRSETVVASFDEQGGRKSLRTNRGADSTIGLFRGEERDSNSAGAPTAVCAGSIARTLKARCP
jgi:hypothetical protein